MTPMKTILSDHPDFVEGFVEYCFNKGFNEKQASELLRIAAIKELAESGDESFQEGLRLGSSGSIRKVAFVKEAIIRRLISKLLPGASPFPAPPRIPGMTGAHPPVPTMSAPPSVLPGAGATHYNLALPKGLAHSLGGAGTTAAAGGVAGAMFGDPENGMMQNALTGAGIGAGARLAMGPMFRGKNFSKFMSGINPLERGASKGSIGVNLLRPMETLGKAITAPGVAKSVGKGLGYGALGGAAYNLGSKISDMHVSPDSSQLTPWYMQGNGAPGGMGGGSPGSPGGTDIFSMPSSLRNVYEGGGASSLGGGAGGVGPMHEISMAKAQQNEIDQKISMLNSQMSSIDDSNPMSHMQRQQFNKELTKLQHARNSAQSSLEEALSKMQQDRARYGSAAASTATSAGRSVDRLQKEYEGNIADYENGQSSTMSNVLNKLNPMNWMNGGLEHRMNRNAERLAQQRALLQRAQMAQQNLSL